MAIHPSKTIRWKLKNIYNKLYDKYMKWRGYEPYGFNFKTNTYIYEKTEELDKWARRD